VAAETPATSRDQRRDQRRDDGRDACVFCGIVQGRIPADVVRESLSTVAFRDTNPQAPTHVLVVSREHHGDLGALAAADPQLAAELVAAAVAVAENPELGLADGWRLVVNTGRSGGQTVGHVHAHVLGGRQMRWPPG
jgi:histidine triad (HIT) family protein